MENLQFGEIRRRGINPWRTIGIILLIVAMPIVLPPVVVAGVILAIILAPPACGVWLVWKLTARPRVALVAALKHVGSLIRSLARKAGNAVIMLVGIALAMTGYPLWRFYAYVAWRLLAWPLSWVLRRFAKSIAVVASMIALVITIWLAIALANGFAMHPFPDAAASWWLQWGPVAAPLVIYCALSAVEAPLNFSFSHLRPPVSALDWQEVAGDVIKSDSVGVIIGMSFFAGVLAMRLYTMVLHGPYDSALIWLNLVQASVTGYAFVLQAKAYAKTVHPEKLREEQIRERAPGMGKGVLRWFYILTTIILFLAAIVYIGAIVLSTFRPELVQWVLTTRIKIGLEVIAMVDNFVLLTGNFVFRRGRPRNRYEFAAMCRGVVVALLWSAVANVTSFQLGFIAEGWFPRAGYAALTLQLVFWQQLYRCVLDVPQTPIYNALEGHRSVSAVQELWHATKGAYSPRRWLRRRHR